MRFFFLLFLSFLLFSCASTPPSNTQNSCMIFEEKKSWYKHTKKSYEKWGVPIHIQLAIIKYESAFQNRAKTERKKLLGVIPWKRKSSAFGYGQVVDGTFDWYKKDTGEYGASRVNFKDVTNFIGWYVNKSHEMLGIRKDDAYNQYLAWHEGQGGFADKSYLDKPELITYARKLEQTAKLYEMQINDCKDVLENRIYWWYF